MDFKEAAEKLKAEGNALVKAGKFHDAINKYQEAIELNPSVAAYHSNLSHCFFKTQRYAEMEAAARRCIEADKTFTKGYWRLAQALNLQERYEEAMLVLDQALEEVDPNNTDLKLLRAQIFSHIEGNRCSLCGKNDATFECSRCKDRHYCSEACQAAEWPKHRTLCVAPSDDVQCNCSHYLKRMQVSDAKRCGRCHRETYCSRECQVKDWKTHKEACRRQTIAESMCDRESNNEIALFYKWYDSGVAPDVMKLSTHAMTKQQFLQQPPSFVVEMKFRFNPNYVGFLPVGRPELKKISDFPVREAEEIQRRFDMYQAPLEKHQLGHMMAVVLLPSSSSTSQPSAIKYRHQIFKPTDYRCLPFHKIMNEFRYEWNVAPKLKASWESRMGKTLDQQQLAFCDDDNDAWGSFLVYAYHLYADRPRFMSHLLVVYFEFGQELGKIEKLTRYEIVTIEEARKRFDKDFIDGIAKKRIDGWVFLPSLFVSDDPFRFRMSAGTHFPPDNANICNYSAVACDQVVAMCFEKLKKAEWPSVESSPSLGDYSID